MIKKVTITLNDDLKNQLEKRRITKTFDFIYEGITYSNCILYYTTESFGNILFIKVPNSLPILAKINNSQVSFFMFNKYLEVISV